MATQRHSMFGRSRDTAGRSVGMYDVDTGDSERRRPADGRQEGSTHGVDASVGAAVENSIGAGVDEAAELEAPPVAETCGTKVCAPSMLALTSSRSLFYGSLSTAEATTSFCVASKKASDLVAFCGRPK